MRSTTGKLLTLALTPLSWLYGAVTDVRNQLFNLHILKQKRFDVPVVCIGNLSVGGTGKTPMVEMLLRYLQTDYRIGVVSRGYKRHTKGFLLGNSKSTPATIGDEPYQMYRKFGSRVKIAVCENRSKGIEQLLRLHPEINLILLDDAFQHRYVQPKISILLMDYKRPVFTDKMLPLGRLREHVSGMYRADFIVVTKCPADIRPIQYRIYSDRISLMKFQKLYFSSIKYLPVQPVFEEEAQYTIKLEGLTQADTILLVTGIANPRPLIKACKVCNAKIKVMHFTDHHDFSIKDLERIENKYSKLKGARKIILTTEKDGGRLLHNPYFPERLKPYTFFIPIETYIRNDWNPTPGFIESLRKAIDAIPKDN